MTQQPVPPPAPRGPRTIGDLVGSAFKTLGSRWGLFLVIELVPMVAMLIYLGVLFGVIGAWVVSAVNKHGDAVGVLSVVGVVLVLGMSLFVLVLGLLQYRTQGMMSLATVDIEEGRRPTFGDLWRRTRGMMLKMFGLMLLLTLVFAIAFGAYIAVIVVALQSAANEDSNIHTMVGVMALMFLVVIALSLIAFIVAVRLLYFIPVMAIERLGAMETLRRTWRITRGNFWRTLGYYLVGSLVVYAASAVVSAVSNLLSVPLMHSYQDNGSSALVGAGVVGGISLLLSAIVSLFTGPYLAIYVTLMYRDQLRRDELAAQRYNAFPGGNPFSGSQGVQDPQNPNQPNGPSNWT